MKDLQPYINLDYRKVIYRQGHPLGKCVHCCAETYFVTSVVFGSILLFNETTVTFDVQFHMELKTLDLAL